MGSWGTSDGSRGRARPGRGLRLPSFSPHKVYEASGSTQVLSGWVPVPQSLQGIAGPLDGLNITEAVTRIVGSQN